MQEHHIVNHKVNEMKLFVLRFAVKSWQSLNRSKQPEAPPPNKDACGPLVETFKRTCFL